MGTEHSGNLEPASKCPKLGDLVVYFSQVQGEDTRVNLVSLCPGSDNWFWTWPGLNVFCIYKLILSFSHPLTGQLFLLKR